MAESGWKDLSGLDTSQTEGQGETDLEDTGVVGHFSIDDTDKFVPDQSQKKYYIRPRRLINRDLKVGSESFNRQDYRQKELHDMDNILRWILEQPSKIEDVEFVTRRSVLTIIAMTRLHHAREWEVTVVLFKGKYYISTDFKASTEKWHNPDYIQRNYNIRKFEQHLTSSEPDGQPNLDAPVNSWETYYRVLKSGISSKTAGKHSVLFSSKTDCLTPSDESVQLQVYHHYIPGASANWYLLSKWWFMCYISDAPTLVVGTISQDGILKKVEEFKTADKPWRFEQTPLWHPTCFNFLADFLQEVKHLVTQDRPCAVFRYQGDRGPVQYQWVNPVENQLPQWYCKKME